MGQGSPKRLQPGLDAGGGGRRGWRSRGLHFGDPAKHPTGCHVWVVVRAYWVGRALRWGALTAMLGCCRRLALLMERALCFRQQWRSEMGVQIPPWRDSPQPSLPGSLFGSVLLPWVTLGMLEPTSPGKLPWEPASRGVDGPGAGAPHGPVRSRRPAGAGHGHLQGPGEELPFLPDSSPQSSIWGN